MSNTQNILGGIQSAFSAQKVLTNAKEIMEGVGDLFDAGDSSAESVLSQVLPTKHGGWRSGDSSDLRGVMRRKLEDARARFNIATGAEFNWHAPSSENVKTKKDFLAETSLSFYAYHIIHDFFSDEELVSRFVETFSIPDKEVIKENIKNLLDNLRLAQNLRVESHRYISKEHELKIKIDYLNSKNEGKFAQEKLGQELVSVNDKYIQMCILNKENQHTFEKCLADISTGFSTLLKAMKDACNEKSSEKIAKKLPSEQKKLLDFFNIIKSAPEKFEMNEGVFDFMCVKDTIKTDPEFEMKVSTLIYRMFYDPVSCYDLVISMGAPGKALLACLSTRSHFFNMIHSRRHLPDSAFVFFKMLGLKKESLKMVEIKEKRQDKGGNESLILKPTIRGSFLYQDIEALKAQESEINNLGVSIFGHIRQEEKMDKNGYANSIWEEVDSRWDNFSISSYLSKRNILVGKQCFTKDSRNKFLNSVSILDEYASENTNTSLQDLFLNRVSKLTRCVDKLLFLLGDKEEVQTSHLKEIKNHIQNITSNYFNHKVIALLSLNEQEHHILDILDNISSLESKNKLVIEEDLKKIFNDFSYYANLSYYYRTFDLKINQTANMAASLIEPNGAIRSVIEQARKQVTETSAKIKAEIDSLKANESLESIRNVLSDHHAFTAMIYCHNEFSKLESANSSKEEIEKRVLEIFIEKIASQMLSHSIPAIRYVEKIDEGFARWLSERIFHKQYSALITLLNIKVVFSDNSSKVVTFESLSESALKSKDNQSFHFMATKALEEILKKEVISFEIILDEANEHNLLLRKIEKGMEELNRLFSQQLVSESITDNLLLYQKNSLLQVIDSIIKEFSLSGGAATELQDLFKRIGLAHREKDAETKASLLKALDKEVKDNKILSAILDKISTLNTTESPTEFDFKSRTQMKENGIGGTVEFDVLFTGKSNSVNLIRKTNGGGQFFRLFKFIMESLSDSLVEESVQAQLQNGPALREKLNNISQKFFGTILNFATFAQNNLVAFTLIAEQISRVSQACEKMSEDFQQVKNDENVEKLEESSSKFFAKLELMSGFSVQLESVIKKVESEKKGIADKLETASQAFAQDAIVAQKADALKEIYCTDACAQAFEDAFFDSAQMEQKGMKESSASFSDFFCQSFAIWNKKNTDHKIIPLHDAHPFRQILGSEFKEFLTIFFKFKLGDYQDKNTVECFKKSLEHWTNFDNIIHDEPYHFEGYYFRGSGFSNEIINHLEKEAKDKEGRATDEACMTFVLKEIAQLRSLLEKMIPSLNRSRHSDVNENQAIVALKLIEAKFSQLNLKLQETFKGKSLTQKQFDTLKKELLFIDDIKKFNTRFFKLGHELLTKFTSNSAIKNSEFPRPSFKKETQYEEHMRLAREELIELRRVFYNIEKISGAHEGIDILKKGRSLFSGGQNGEKIESKDIIQLKSAYSIYKSQWADMTECYFDLKDEKLQQLILTKFKYESKSFQETEMKLLGVQTLIDILECDPGIGQFLFGEISLFKFLKKAEILESFEKIRTFIDRKNNFKDESPFSVEEIHELEAIALEIQTGMNSFAKTSMFKHFKGVGIFRKILDKFSEWFWSYKNEHELQIQLNVKRSSELKASVTKLIEDLEKFTFDQTVISFSFILSEIEMLQSISDDFKKTMKTASEYERNKEFFKSLEGCDFSCFTKDEIERCEKFVTKIDGEIEERLQKGEGPGYSELLFINMTDFNETVSKLKQRLLENPIASKILLREKEDNSGEKYFEFVPNLADLMAPQNVDMQRYLQEVFPYSPLVSSFIEHGQRAIDIVMALGTEKYVIIYSPNADKDKQYSLKNKDFANKIEENEKEEFFEIQKQGDQFVIIASAQIVPFDECPHEFLDCLSVKDQVKIIFDEIIRPCFPDMEEPNVLQLDSFKDLKRIIKKTILYKDNNGPGGITFNFLTSCFYYSENLENDEGMEIKIARSAVDKSLLASVYSPVTQNFEYAGWWAAAPLPLGDIFLRCAQAVNSAQMQDVELMPSLPATEQFFSSAFSFVSILSGLLGDFNLANDLPSQKLGAEIYKKMVEFDKNLTALKDIINVERTRKKFRQEMELIIKQIADLCLKHFNIIIKSKTVVEQMGEFSKVSLFFKGRSYDFSQRGFLHLLLENFQVNNMDGFFLFLREPVNDENLVSVRLNYDNENLKVLHDFEVLTTF
jgi:hypothetical protein